MLPVRKGDPAPGQSCSPLGGSTVSSPSRHQDFQGQGGGRGRLVCALGPQLPPEGPKLQGH